MHAYIFLLPIFRFQRTSGFSCPILGLSPTLGFFACFRTNGIMSCHLMSCHLSLWTHREWSLREPVLLPWGMYTSACAHFQLSMCMLAGEHTHTYTSACAHFQLRMCTHSGDHVYIYTSACVHFQLSMCMLSVEHAHVHFSMCTL